MVEFIVGPAECGSSLWKSGCRGAHTSRALSQPNVRGAIVSECHALLQHVPRDRARGKCTSRVLTVVLHPAIASGASQGH